MSDTIKTAEIQFFDRRWVNSHLEENDALEGAILKRRKMRYLFDFKNEDEKGREMPETDLTVFDSEEESVEYYFKWYREHGYPMIDINDYNPRKELSDLVSFDETTLERNGVIDQSMVGCGFLWAFFPHWVNVPTYKDASLSQNWKDDRKLKALIRKTYRFCMLHEGAKWSVNRIRQNAKVYCSKQSVSNFRPSVAKYLYNAYGDWGNVYDPCGGWGGRMMGFLASNCERYVCCEPSTKSAKGLQSVADTFSYVGKDIEVHCECAENYIPEKESFNMAFTSPPYFNTEKYSDEETQSYKRYPVYDKWVEGFLKPMIRNCHHGLIGGGICCLT